MSLEQLLAGASHGSPEALELFYRQLLDACVYVPERFQQQPLSDQPKYPDNFFNVLGVQTPDKVLVPAFTAPAHITAWFGSELKYRELGFVDLIKRLPEQWWISLNPGQEVEKEFSPWELQLLQGGRDTIAELVAELSCEQQPAVELRPIGAEELQPLKEKLKTYAAKRKEIRRLTLAREIAAGDASQTGLLLGLELRPCPQATKTELQKDLQALAQSCLIGAETVRVLAGQADDAAHLLGCFALFEPVYVRGGLMEKIRRLLFG